MINVTRRHNKQTIYHHSVTLGLAWSSSAKFSYPCRWPQLAKGSQHKILIKLQPDGLQCCKTTPPQSHSKPEKTKRINSSLDVVSLHLNPLRNKQTLSAVLGFSCCVLPYLQTHSSPHLLQVSFADYRLTRT